MLVKQTRTAQTFRNNLVPQVRVLICRRSNVPRSFDLSPPKPPFRAKISITNSRRCSSRITTRPRPQSREYFPFLARTESNFEWISVAFVFNLIACKEPLLGQTEDSRLTCIACHDPHEPLVRDASFYDQECLSCHSSQRGEIQGAAAHLLGVWSGIAKGSCLDSTIHNPTGNQDLRVVCRFMRIGMKFIDNSLTADSFDILVPYGRRLMVIVPGICESSLLL